MMAALKRLLADAVEHAWCGEDLDSLWLVINVATSELQIELPEVCRQESRFEEATLLERREIIGKIYNLWPATHSDQRNSLDRRVEFLARTFDLSPNAHSLLALLARRAVYRSWQRIIYQLSKLAKISSAQVIALLCEMSLEAVYVGFSERGELVQKGLAQEAGDPLSLDLGLFEYVKLFLQSKASTQSEMLAAIMPILPPSTLDQSSFEHMARDLERAVKLVEHGLSQPGRVNILLYGAPGTGKTEFARLVAGLNDILAVSVGEADEYGGEPLRRERLSHLLLCRNLTKAMRKSVLVIDEADDLFLSGIENRKSKLWLNKLVEDGEGPHIWIVNQASDLDEPILRRMDLAVRFDNPPIYARLAMIDRIAGHEEDCWSAEERQTVIDGLASLNASPAISAIAMETARRLQQSGSDVLEIARGLVEACGRYDERDEALMARDFDPALSHASIDLEELAHKLSRSQARWALLLSGPPGTGKSSYARYLAQCCDSNLICRTGAELLGKYVGDTEKAIAAAFADAERRNAILLIDEADSLLANRDLAERNWEVSMTNQFLSQLERNKVRFIATTNRAHSLDPATARRFVLRVEFEALDLRQARALFEKIFQKPAPGTLDHLGELTPGTFAKVKQRADLLGTADPALLAQWLADEADASPIGRHRLGF